MKKYIITVCCLTLFSPVFVSCLKLKHEDSTQIQADKFLKNANDMNLYVMSLYSPFRSASGDATNWGFYSMIDAGYYAVTDFTTDILTSNKVANTPTANATYFVTHTYDLNARPILTPLWNKYFPHISNITQARMAYLRIKDSGLPGKEQYMAEAEGIVAWTGMILFDMFGPLPVPTDDQLYQWDADPLAGEWLPRPSRDAYLNYMIQNAQDAVNALPETQPSFGRLTKGAARMLLLRLYLMKGDFADALPVARDLYAQGASGGGTTYALNPHYNALFAVDGSKEKEYILAIPCDRNNSNAGSPNQWYCQVLPTDYPLPSPAAKAVGGTAMRWDFYDTYEPGDDRLKTIVASYVNTKGLLVDRSIMFGALPFKYQPDPNTNSNFSSNDIPVFRYAEAILIYAECEFEVNGRSALTDSLINQVRSRALLPPIATVVGAIGVATPEAYREAIFTERAHELYGEGVRHMDLVRQDTTGQKWAEYGARGLDPLSASNYNPDPRRFVFPLPDSTVRQSNGVFLQNPGY